MIKNLAKDGTTAMSSLLSTKHYNLQADAFEVKRIEEL